MPLHSYSASLASCCFHHTGQEILESFFWGRAFAVTLNKRLAQFALDAFSDLGKTLTNKPMKLQEFKVQTTMHWYRLQI